MDRMIIMEITRKTICIVFILRWCESIFGLLSVFTFEDLLAILLTFFQIFLFQSTDSNIFRLESNKNLFGVSRIFCEGSRILMRKMILLCQNSQQKITRCYLDGPPPPCQPASRRESQNLIEPVEAQRTRHLVFDSQGKGRKPFIFSSAPPFLRSRVLQ